MAQVTQQRARGIDTTQKVSRGQSDQICTGYARDGTLQEVPCQNCGGGFNVVSECSCYCCAETLGNNKATVNCHVHCPLLLKLVRIWRLGFSPHPLMLHFVNTFSRHCCLTVFWLAWQRNVGISHVLWFLHDWAKWVARFISQRQ